MEKVNAVLEEEPLIPYPGRYLPLKAKSPRQGKRKKDRWAPCRHCGTPGVLRCFRCKHWLCRDCVRMRKAPRAPLGTYHAVCYPKCVLRKPASPFVKDMTEDMLCD